MSLRALVVLLLLSHAAAASPLWADHAAMEGVAEVSANDPFLVTASARFDGAAPMALEIHAASATIAIATETGFFVGTSDAGQTVRSDVAHSSMTLSNATFNLADARPDRKLVAFASAVEGSAAEIQATSADAVAVTAREPQPSTGSSEQPDTYFSTRIVEGGVVVYDADELDVVLSGDIQLEIYELDLHFDGDQDGMIATGFRQQGTTYEDTFARIHLQGATLRYAAQSPAQWIGAHQWDNDMPEGMLTMGDATIPDPGAFSLVSRYNQVGLQQDSAPAATTVSLPAAWQGSLLTAGLAFTLLGVSVFVAVRLGRDPKGHMEKALENGDHLKAAAVAAKILADDPSNEGARIGRSVALTRAGQWDDVVDELEQHKRRYAATDGVLDYLLGVAYLETGRREQARDAMERAVAATPALAPDAVARIPGLAPRLEGAYA